MLHFLTMLTVVGAAFAAAFCLVVPGLRTQEAWVHRPWMIPLWGVLGDFDLAGMAEYLGGGHDPINAVVGPMLLFVCAARSTTLHL